MKFTIIAEDKQSKARTGLITTGRGAFKTPVFMPVGTLGSVKAIHQWELEEEINAPVILGNSYHLFLRPGIDIIESAGGLHKFIHWKRHLLTDSGGFQVYSLATNRKISDEGVSFQSHIDGAKHFISPESAIDIQRSIGADVIMAFDECTSWPVEFGYAEKSMHLTHNWLKRCIKRFQETKHKYEHPQSLFPIVQGSTFAGLRKISAGFVAEQNCDGNAIGGLSVGEPAEQMYEMTQMVCDILPHNKPRYLMGVGTPENILESISLGIDMFDCVIPTRNARHGLLYTLEGVINIKNEKWKKDFNPVNENPLSYIDQYYSRAYIRHLIYSKEILGYQVTSLNNLAFYMWLVNEAKIHIMAGDFTAWKRQTIEKISRRL
jgi:queuine tRNA-ribosyltransferase